MAYSGDAARKSVRVLSHQVKTPSGVQSSPLPPHSAEGKESSRRVVNSVLVGASPISAAIALSSNW